MDQLDTVFIQFKTRSLEKLQIALHDNMVDKRVIPIISLINDDENYVTTSSCAGRMVMMQLPTVGDKKQAMFLGRWHRHVEFSEVRDALEKYSKGQLWFIAQSPIFHIAVKSIDAADDLVKLGIGAGFKHSGFKSIKTNTIVELCSTERMDVPLGINDKCIVSEKYLLMIVKLGNDLLLRSQKKLDRLQKIFEKRMRK